MVWKDTLCRRIFCRERIHLIDLAACSSVQKNSALATYFSQRAAFDSFDVLRTGGSGQVAHGAKREENDSSRSKLPPGRRPSEPEAACDKIYCLF
jgi:hypothetical protein